MYDIFKLAVSISTPLALAGLTIAVLFYIFSKLPQGKDESGNTKRVVNYTFILALVISAIAIAAYIWTNLGYTTMEGTLFIHRGPNFEQTVETHIPVSVLQVREPSRTDESGRFSIPLRKNELRKKYIVMVEVDKKQKFFDVNADVNDFGDLQLHDTIRVTPPDPGSTADLILSESDLKQVQPLVHANPKINDTTVYCEALRFKLLIKHNQKEQKVIRVDDIQLEWAKVPNPAKLDYSIDASKVQGFGIVDVRQYYFTVVNQAYIKGKYLKNKDLAVEVDPENIFQTVKNTEALNLEPSGDDSYFQADINLNLIADGLYRFRLTAKYNTPDQSKSQSTPWIYLLKKP